MIKNKTKKNFAQIVATAILTLCVSIPVAAATTNVPDELLRSNTQYCSFSNIPLYSGVIAFTSSGACSSREAVVKLNRVTYNDLNSLSDVTFNVSTYPSSSEIPITSYKLISRNDTVTFSSASHYPTESIRAGFSRDNINGTYYLSGKFYYNGLN